MPAQFHLSRGVVTSFRSVTFVALLPLLVGIGAIHAAPTTSAGTPADPSVAMQSAFDAFRHADATGAVAALQSVVSADPKLPAAEVQIGTAIDQIALWLLNSSDHAKANLAATTAISWITPVLPRLSTHDQSLAQYCIGHLYEVVLNQPVQARTAYAAAVTADRTNIPAQVALKHLDAIQAQIQAKNAATALLRQRAGL